MIQFILGALGVVAISEFTKKGRVSKMAHGGRVGNDESILKQNDKIYFTFNSPVNKIKDSNIIKIYDFASNKNIMSESNIMDLPLPSKNVDYAIVNKKPTYNDNIRWMWFNDVIGVDFYGKRKKPIDDKFRLTLEEILDDVYVLKAETDFSEHYVVIPKNEITIDWEKTKMSINTTANTIRKRKQEQKDGIFKFSRGYYDSDNTFRYDKKKKMARGGEMNYYLVTFGYKGDDGYEIVTSKPILANSEDEASMMLKEDFEMNEGISCDIISVKKKI